MGSHSFALHSQSTSPTWSRSKTGSSGISSMAGLPGLDPANPRHLFFTRVFELLTEVAPWLRVCQREGCRRLFLFQRPKQIYCSDSCAAKARSEEHTSELQSQSNLVCRLLLEKKKNLRLRLTSGQR